jgi:arylsulfatase A-like enzyme
MKNQELIVLLLPLFVFGSCSNNSNRNHDSIEKPNILFIAVDDLNSWLGCYNGHPQAITPNIDRLAKNGLLFSNAHCQSPICQPSRTSLMTGLFPTTTGIHFFYKNNFKQEPVTADKVALTEYFTQNGYYTMGVGKITHSGMPKLFDEFKGQGNFGPFVSREPEEKLSYRMGHPYWDWGAFPEHDSLMSDYKNTQWAIDQLQRDFDKPFFLAMGYLRPHVPMYVPQKWFDMYPLESIQLPEVNENDLDDISEYALDLTYGNHTPRHKWIVENNEWHHAVQSYLACISFVDHYIGELLTALENSKYADNTIIVLWSDHGFHLGEKLRWEKRSLWENSTRVPLIFAGPGIPKNKICTRPVGLIDLYPTLNELCGFPVNEDLEGVSIVPLLRNPDLPWNRPVLTSLGPDSHSVRTERWRFIMYGDSSMELYDHEKDPKEWDNLAYKAEYAKTIDELKEFLPKYSRPMPEGSYDSGTLTLYN